MRAYASVVVDPDDDRSPRLGSVLHSRCPDILPMPGAPQGALDRCLMPARVGMRRMEGRLASAVRPSSGTASKRQASSAPGAGEAFVLSQVNPELVV